MLDRPTGKLSAGQKTRVALAKALINGPSCCCWTSRPRRSIPIRPTWCEAISSATSAASRATILLASHNMAEVERLCSNVLMLKTGRLVDQGSPEELLARYGRANLEQVFLDIARRPPRQGGAPRVAAE